MELYKVTGKDGRACHGGSGSWFLPKGKRPGKWMPRIENIEPCKSGYHLCKPEHLVKWLGEEIWIAEYKGEMIEQDDKVVVQQARLISKVNDWNERTVRLFLADCAEHVLKCWESLYPNDKRPHKAIETARAYANGDASEYELAVARRAAEDAAEYAAWSAARRAARRAAWSAARRAAWSAARRAARRAAWSAARSAARSAAWSAACSAAGSAAWYAARSAAWSAACSAEEKWQTELLFDYLEGRK